MLNLGVSTLSSLILGRVILIRLGSDYNGLNSIISQFLTVITLVEGGFTTASLVALFQPYTNKDLSEINQVLAESSYKFRKIGLYALLFGLVFAAIFAALIQTPIPYLVVLAVLWIALLSTVFNLTYVSRLRILFQAAQDEYIYALITLISNLFTRGFMILLLLQTENIVIVRMVYCFFAILTGIAVRLVFQKRYPFIDLSVSWDHVKRINGTRDVLIGKVVSVVYSSAPSLFLSVFANTVLTSVYSVYTSIINVVTSIMNIAISSPQNALGQVLHENDSGKSLNVMEEFEYFVILALTVLFSALGSVLLSFIGIYTRGVTDAEYINATLAAILLSTFYLQLLHIPSGLCIYMGGYFSVERKIQIIALCVLLPCNLIFGFSAGFYGILMSNILCNLVLAGLEIGYVHKYIFPGSLPSFFKSLLPNLILTVLLIVFLQPIAVRWITGYFSFLIVGCCSVLVAAAAVFLLNFVLLHKRLMAVCVRLLRTLRKG